MSNWRTPTLKIQRLFALFLAGVAVAAPAYGTIWSVSLNGAVADFVSVQAAIDAAATGDTVLVEPGRYDENIQFRGSDIVLETTQGEFEAAHVVTCCGLQCDRVARMCGANPGVHIIPFRGEYYELVPEKRHLVKNLIYPVPDPRFPFLGVHFTRRVKGGVEAGPNAVLAFKREGYTLSSFELRDVEEMLGFSGFWKMAGTHWRMGLDEFHRSFSKAAFVRALQRLMPEIEEADLKPGGAGVRAQAVDRDGRLIDDFLIMQDERFIHVLNAPSPAATASLSIGRSIAEMAKKSFSLS